MPRSKKTTVESELPELKSPTPLRPQTLRRRISLTFNTILAALPVRRNTPQSDPIQRPRTAPAPEHEAVLQLDRSDGVSPASGQLPVPQIKIPLLSVSEEPCPYDPTMYHSFPSIKRSWCDFCGMRPLKSRSSTPRNDCRSRSPSSHMKLILQRRLGIKVGAHTPINSPSYRSKHSPASSEEGLRIMPPGIAAKRIGNPPRSASLPCPALILSIHCSSLLLIMLRRLQDVIPPRHTLIYPGPRVHLQATK